MKPVFAQGLTIPWGTGGQTRIEGLRDFRFASVGQIIQTAIPFIFAFAGMGLLLMIISAGFTLLTSAGDAKKLEEGKQRLTYALVGFLIIFASYWLVQIAGKIFGLTEISDVFK